MISFRNFLVSGLTFKSIIHFEFIFVYGMRKYSSLILLHAAVWFSQHFFWRGHLFPIVYSCLFCHRLHVCVLSHFSHVWLCAILWTARLLCSWGSPGKNTGMSCRALLQGIFPTHELKPPLLCLPAFAGRFFTTSAT